MPATACCAFGLSPGGLPGRLVTVGVGLLRLSLGVIRAGRLGRLPRPGRVLPGLAGPGLGLGRPGLGAGHRLVPLLPRRCQLLLRGLRLLLGSGLRLPRLGLPRVGLPRGEARLPRISLGLLGPGLKPGPGFFGRRDLRLKPGPLLGLVPLGVPAGLRHLLLRGPAHPVQLRPGRLGRLLRLSQPRINLPGLAGPGSPCLRGPRLLLGGGPRLPRLGLPRLGLLGAGLKPGPGLFSRRDPRFQPGPQPGLVPLGVPAGLRHLLLRGPAHPVQLRPGRLGRPGLRAGHRLVPLLPRRGHLLLRGPRLLLGGGLRLPCLGLPRLGLLGAGLKPGLGLLARRDLRLEPGPQPGLVPLGVPAGLRHLLLRGPAHPVQLHPSRLGRPGLGAGHCLVPLLPRRDHLLLRVPRLLLGSGLRLPRLGLPRLSLRRRSTRLLRLGQPRLGLLGAGLKPGPLPGLVPLGVPAGLRHLLLRGPAHPVQLRLGRLGRLPRPRRVLPGLAGPGLGPGRPRLGCGRPGLRAGHRLVPLLPRRGHLLPRGLLGLGGPCPRGLPRGHRLLLGGGLRRQRLSQPRLSLRRRSTRLPRISLGPLAAPPEREPRPARVPRAGPPPCRAGT